VDVLVDRSRADLTFCAGAGEPVHRTSVLGSDDEIERNAPGGRSQPRYQQRAEDSWRHNAGQVADAVSRQVTAIGSKVLLLSGDVRAAQLLLERLPHKPDLIIEQLACSRSADGSQSDRPAQLSAALRRSAAMQHAVLPERIQTHLGSDGLAVEGSRDTINALAAGRVAMLVVSDDPNDARTALVRP
jgi:peptide subunit release factor 1 (eRF1)